MNPSGDYIGLILPIFGISLVAGCLFACRTISARLWFLLLMPPLYGMLWLVLAIILSLPLALLEGALGSKTTADLYPLIVTAATLSLFVLNCIMLYRDGKRGLRLMASGSIAGRGTRYTADTRLPIVISERRLELK